ncbi:MAG: hypothetical protein SNJ66_12725 [Chloroherpetonaceae bacterium]
MRTHLFQKALLALLFVSLLSACSKDDNPTNGGGGGGQNSFTINGAGINNRTYTVPDAPLGSPFNIFAIGFFEPQENITVITNVGVAPDDTAGAGVIIGFRGNQAGNFQGSSTQPRIIQVVVGDRAFVGGFDISEPGSPTITGTTFNLNVTGYGQVGGRIQGNYTGTLRQVTGDKGGLGNASITITGNFNVVRLADDFEDDDDRTIKPFSYKEKRVY